jgi:hypothetical protein
MTEENSVQIFYMDDHGNIVPKDQATQVRIIEYDANGERIFETYGIITPNPKQEVEK